jgi:hypothetical protein
LDITFDRFSWQPAQTVPYENCRLPPMVDSKSAAVYKEGEIIECLHKGNSDALGWHQARVKAIKVGA